MLEALEGLSVEVERAGSLLEVRVSRDYVLEAAARLKRAGFDHVKTVIAVDDPDQRVLRLSYLIAGHEAGRGLLLLTVTLPREEPRAPSLAGIWPSVELQEREVWELFGVVFENHPDLRPLLLDRELVEKKVMRRDFRIDA